MIFTFDYHNPETDQPHKITAQLIPAEVGSWDSDSDGYSPSFDAEISISDIEGFDRQNFWELPKDTRQEIECAAWQCLQDCEI